MSMSSECVTSLLEANKDSLEELHLFEINDIVSFDLNVPQLFLKKLCFYRQHSTRLASILIESSASTLKEVELNEIEVDYEGEVITSPETTLSLTRFMARHVQPEIVFQVLRSSSQTLRDLKFEYLDPFNENIHYTDLNLNLTRLVGTHVYENVVEHILDSQQKPINVLLLENII